MFRKEDIVLLITGMPVLGHLSQLQQESAPSQLKYLAVNAVLVFIIEQLKLKIVPSRNNSSGLFYPCVVLPIIFLEIVSKQNNYSEHDDMMHVFAAYIDSLTFSLCFVIFTVVLEFMPLNTAKKLQIIIPLSIVATSTLLFLHFFNFPVSKPLVLYFILSVICVALSSYYLPNCFTTGELLLLLQITFPFVLIFTQSDLLFQCQINTIAVTVLFIVLLLTGTLILLAILHVLSTNVFAFCCVSYFTILISLICPSIYDFMKWFIFFLSDNYPNRQLLLAFWFIELFICAAYITLRPSQTSSSTVERKYFHGIVLLTYIPGIFYDIPLLFLCSIAATCFLILLELIRIMKVTPLASILNEKFQIYVDAQDSGCLILTPLYLILGQSLPIWVCCFQDWILLSSSNPSLPPAIFSGIVSVGIGDTAASVFGSKFGKHNWPGSSKTMEGTAASFLCQLTFSIPFINYGNLSFMIWTVLSISLIESFTDQIDNLILPVFAFFLLNSIC